MPNWTSFTINVTGPQEDCDELAGLLEKDLQAPVEGADPEEPLLRFDTGTWGEWTDSQRGVWLGRDWTGGSPKPFIVRSEGGLWFYGTAAWCPPLQWMEMASLRYPRLSFTSSSTTESEWRETWTAQGGDVRLQEEWHYDIQADTVTRWVKHERLIIDHKGGVPILDFMIDGDDIRDCEELRNALIERLALLEQYYVVSRFREGNEYREALASRLDDNDLLLDAVRSQIGIEKLDPADDDERRAIAENRKRHYKEMRSWQRFGRPEYPHPEQPTSVPPPETGDPIPF